MTVIAWDGTTLAADRRCTNFGYAYPCTKLFRVGETLIGVNGSAKHVGALLAWFAGTRAPATYPFIKKEEDDSVCYALAIERDRLIRVYEGTPYPYVVHAPFYACGAGRDFAVAAMSLGCDARKAVEVASMFETSCGNGVDTLTFEDAHT